MTRNGKKYLLTFGLVIIAAAICVSLTPLYTGGDQVAYRKFWDFAQESSLSSVILQQYVYVGSIEPGYAFLIQLFSKVIEKDTLSILASLSIIFLISKFYIVGVINSVQYLLYGLNFYTFVIFLSADRLKYCVLAYLLVEWVMYKNWIKSRLLLLVPAFFHLQYLLFLPLRLALDRNIRVGQTFVVLTIVGGLIGLLLPYLENNWIDVADGKWSAYGLQSDIHDIIRLVLFAAILFALLGFRITRDYVLITSWALATITLFGAERNLLVLFFITVFYMKNLKPLTLILATILGTYYFSKLLMFSFDVYTFGNGFIERS